MVERNLDKLVLVNFNKEESYTKVLALFDEQAKETAFKIILLFTSVLSYTRCHFFHKITEQKIVVLDQNRTPYKQLGCILEKI